MLKSAAIKDHVPSFWPIVSSITGAALVATAWPLSTHEPVKYSDIAYSAAAFLRALLPFLFIGIYIRPLVPAKTSLHLLLFLTLMNEATIPFKGEWWWYHDLIAQCLAMMGVFLLIFGLSSWQRAQPWLRSLGRFLQRHERISPKALRYGAVALFLTITVSLSGYCFWFTPSYTDSMAQYVHGKFVASGHLYYIKGTPVYDFFPVWLMLSGAEKWYSQYPPLHQTILGLGHILHIPWLVNPIEGALTLLTVYAIGRRDYSENMARLACALMFMSPFILVMSSEFMNHSTALLFLTLLVYCFGEIQPALARGEKTKAAHWGLASGLCAGCIFLTRPLAAIGIAMPFAIAELWYLKKNRRDNGGPCLWMIAGGTICVLFQLWYNHETTGKFFKYAYAVYHSDSLINAMGYFGDNFINPITKMRQEWFMLSTVMFQWSLPFIFLIALPCLTPNKHPTTKLLIGLLVSSTLFNMLNQFANTVFGPRYMYESSVPIAMLTALGILQLPSLLASFNTRLKQVGTSPAVVAVTVMLLCVSAVATRFPKTINDFHNHFMDSHMDLYYSILKQTEHPALVFMARISKTDPHPKDPDAEFRWMVWSYPPDDKAPVIFARDRGDEKNRALMKYYPNRKAYVESKEKLTAVGDSILTPPAKPAP